eukprot:CAMPEP_0176217372 /NCGR_PEP_ID=MMETSP0121_2-20121125/17660_1 /TAXON_ID=160619 /ORGANISM="Kryptoperidinium foliaceum, Strain CCMP 1326" /LENGTH=922 /DNA_ID=CAMNT_0017556503 /DNA_START=15 /DNA_END=2781 /DNA_ORIENTATION=+
MEVEEPPAADAEKEEGEKEVDAPEDKRKRVGADAVALSVVDTTLNAMVAPNRKMAMTLTDGGFQYLLAGARATAGMKAGRYMFEVAVVEHVHLTETVQGRPPYPRHLVRVGVSTAGSSLLMPESAESVCFDSEGNFAHDGKQTQNAASRVLQKFAKDQVFAVVVNLDPSSKVANTISLFRDGQRIGEPHALPESLIGKTLYPTVTYRNVTLRVNFGPTPRAALPFVCRMLSDAAAADVELAPKPKEKNEVVFPVGLPDKGYFDWVDQFVKEHPGHVELSDRKIFAWAQASGLWGEKSRGGWDSSDKPDMKFGIPMLEDFTVRKVLSTIAPTVPRSYVVPELTSNLLAEDRKAVARRFASAGFVCKAVVLMGEPDAAYKAYVQELMLAEKQAKADAERAAKESKERRKDRWGDAEKKDAEPKEAEEKKAADADDKEKSAEAKAGEGNGDAEPKAEEGKEAEEAKEEANEEAKEEPKEEAQEPEPPVELTEEEKAAPCRKAAIPDVQDRVLRKAFADFTLPSQEEGFDCIAYPWQPADACAKVLKEWVLEQKRTQLVEDLQPGEWFKEQTSKWEGLCKEWRKAQTDYSDTDKGKAKAKAAEDKKSAADGEAKEGEAEEASEGAQPMEINSDDLDVFEVKNVCDIGNGQPLFASFAYEDWTLLSTRFEMHLLLHAFKRDLNDPDRPSFGEQHLGYYYSKYFKKTFDMKIFGVQTFAEFIELIKETIAVNEETTFLTALLSDDTPLEDFVRHTEAHRRERQQRIDAGDETAKLKFSRAAPAPREADRGAAAAARASGAATRAPGPGASAAEAAAAAATGATPSRAATAGTATTTGTAATAGKATTAGTAATPEAAPPPQGRSGPTTPAPAAPTATRSSPARDTAAATAAAAAATAAGAAATAVAANTAAEGAAAATAVEGGVGRAR